MKKKKDSGKFIIINELAEAFYGLKAGKPQFTTDWEMAKPMENENQLKIVQRGTVQKLEALYI